MSGIKNKVTTDNGGIRPLDEVELELTQKWQRDDSGCAKWLDDLDKEREKENERTR